MTRDCCSWPTPISWRPFDGRVLPSHSGLSHCFPARWLSPAARGNFVGEAPTPNWSVTGEPQSSSRVASYVIVFSHPNRLYSIFHSVVLRWCRFNDFLAMKLWDLHFRINLGRWDGETMKLVILLRFELLWWFKNCHAAFDFAVFTLATGSRWGGRRSTSRSMDSCHYWVEKVKNCKLTPLLLAHMRTEAQCCCLLFWFLEDTYKCINMN